MAFIIRPSGAADLSAATLHAEGTLPQTISGLAAGTYQIGRVAWASDPVTVGAAFTGRSAVTTQNSYLKADPISPAIAGTGQGMFSAWIRYTGADGWNSPDTTQRILDLRAGTNTVLQVYTASSGRLVFLMNGVSNTVTPTSTFADNTWYHILWSWRAGSGGWNQLRVNGASVGSPPDLTAASIAINGASLDKIAIGGDTGTGSEWNGELGHVYLNLAQSIDMTAQTNREKFILGGQPVDMGADGSRPTGTAPAFYIDGAPPGDWNNKGSGPTLEVVGTLGVGGTPGL